jgi:foldase protein PrsA
MWWAAAVTLVAVAGCRKAGEGEAPAARVVARVGERKIQAPEVYRGLYPQGRPKGAKADPEAALVLAWAEENGVAVADDDVAARLAIIQADYGARGFATYLQSQDLTVEAFKTVVRDDLLVEAAIEAAVVEEVSVSYDDVVAYYNVHADEFETPAEYHLQQIITDEQARAEEALAKLEYGAAFEEVAREISMSPDRHRGGDVGYTTLEALPPAVAAAVEKLPRGQTSGLLETPYGFEIVKVLHIREPRRKPLAEVRTEIEDRLRTEREEKAYGAWLDELRKKAKISIDESALAEL